jgi:hypothetical protein
MPLPTWGVGVLGPRKNRVGRIAAAVPWLRIADALPEGEREGVQGAGESSWL